MTRPLTRPLRIGVQIQPQHADFPRMREAVREAEALGADVIFTWDHFYPLTGDPEGKHFEAWTTLASMAEVTERAEIGVLVTCNSYRNPDLLADMARTVDHISDGRLIFGIGAGWFEKDYVEYGYEFGTRGSRIAALAEAMPRIERRWAKLEPAPRRRPGGGGMPVLIGGGGEKKTLPIVARHADIWHTFAQGEELDRKLRVLGEYCAAVGRDVAEIELSVGADGNDLDGVAALREAGAGLITCGVGGPDYDLTPLRNLIAWRDG